MSITKQPAGALCTWMLYELVMFLLYLCCKIIRSHLKNSKQIYASLKRRRETQWERDEDGNAKVCKHMCRPNWIELNWNDKVSSPKTSTSHFHDACVCQPNYMCDLDEYMNYICTSWHNHNRKHREGTEILVQKRAKETELELSVSEWKHIVFAFQLLFQWLSTARCFKYHSLRENT